MIFFIFRQLSVYYIYILRDRYVLSYTSYMWFRVEFNPITHNKYKVCMAFDTAGVYYVSPIVFLYIIMRHI